MVIIGDTHGCYETLLALMEQIPKDQKVVFVGDLIDRGPKSKDVVEFVKKGGYDCVIGNHEKMFIEEGLSPRFEGIWIPNGGMQTLESYKIKKYTDNDGNDSFPVSYTRLDKKLMAKHIEWMKTLPLYLEYPEVKDANGRHLVVSHSNVGKFWGWNQKRRETNAYTFEHALVWSRHNFHDNPEIYNVVGHTPTRSWPRTRQFYCNVDTGCVFRGQGYGFLTALQFPEMKVYRQLNVDHYVGWKFEGWDDPDYEQKWTEKDME